MIHWHVHRDREALARRAAEDIAAVLNQAAGRRGAAVFALCGGSSVVGIFGALRERRDIDWPRVHIFMVDERAVPLDDPESNFRQAKEILLDSLVKDSRLPAENLHPFRVKPSRPDLGASDYTAELTALGGRFDLALLGVGQDGHVAAIFPEHASFSDDSPHYIVHRDSPKPPRDRLTASRSLLLTSQAAVLLFLGEDRREALRRFRDPAVTVNQCPAKLAESIPESHIYTDLPLP